MSQARDLSRMVIALGIIFIFVGLVIPGEDSPWTAFIDSMEGTEFPTLNNPFSTRQFTFHIDADGTDEPASTVDNDAVPNCVTTPVPVDWFGCVDSFDADVSYAQISLVDFEFSVSLEAFPDTTRSWRIITLQVDFQCHREGAGSTDNVFFDFGSPVVVSTAGIEFNRVTCTSSPSDEFGNETVIGNIELAGITPLDLDDVEMFVRLDGLGVVHDFSYVQVTITFQAEAACTSEDTLTFIGCILLAVVTFVIDFIVLIVSLIVFGLQIAVFIVQIGFAIATGLFAMFAFLFAIPGAPVIVQAIIDVIVMGMIIVLLVSFVKLLPRGPI